MRRMLIGVTVLSAVFAASACNTAGTNGQMEPTLVGFPAGSGMTAASGNAAQQPPVAIGVAGVGVPAGGAAALPAAGSVAIAGSGGGAAGDSPGAAGMPAVVVPPDNNAAADWRMMGYDLASTYLNSAETLLSKVTAAKLAVAWTRDLGGPVYGAALQIGDTMYASGVGGVFGLDAATGKQLWTAMVPTTSSMSYVEDPSTHTRTLYLNSKDGQMVAINAADGKQLWTKPHDAQKTDGSSSAIPVGDLLLVGGSNGYAELSGGGTSRGYLAALKIMTGDPAWTTYTVPTSAKGASVWSSASVDVAAGRVFAGTGNNYGAPATDSSDSIIAFELKTGNMLWKNQRVKNDTFGGGIGPDSDFGANPVLYEAMVGGAVTKLVADGSKGGAVVALRREDGMEVWTRALCAGANDGSSGIFTNFSWTGKNLLVACNQGGPATLYALDGATGNIVWMRALPGQVWGRTAVANGVGFVGTGTKLEVFDVDSGAVIKSFPSKAGTVASTITVAHGRVAFGEGLAWSSGQYGTTLTVLGIQ
jgi:polyvinyl alcohol dehydrogenase (cytochrome)